ncbi:MAG TPA: hypothetical protein VFA03_13075 [Acetobacteraceae bacterium]|nr:hypothetical protein [Acetobacteraceae bacterium]
MLAAAADWSVDPNGRWIATAKRSADGWRASAPEPVGDLGSLIERLRAEAGGAPVVLGLDVPLGLPHAFATKWLPDANFPAFLRRLAQDDPWFRAAETVPEIAPGRPFAPFRPGGGIRRANLVAALGLTEWNALLRRCDRLTGAGALFWTLGAKQVGKAALCAWRDVVGPALRGVPPARLWPFDGALVDLVADTGVVLGEIYPAAAQRRLGLGRASKTNPAARRAAAPALIATLRALRVEPEPALARALAAGFGTDRPAADRFDAVLGLLSVLWALEHGAEPPRGAMARQWEGWILGLPRPGTTPVETRERGPIPSSAPPPA